MFYGNALVVDDNETNRLVAASLLKRIGLSVTTAVNGQQAVDLIKTGSGFDIVFMDIRMPILSGFQATMQIRAWEQMNDIARKPIVALTADLHVDAKFDCLDAGMDSFLAKPVDAEKLYETVARYLLPGN